MTNFHVGQKTRSIRLLTRLGIAIEKLGQNISKIGGGGCVHAKSGADLGARRPVSIDDYRGKSDAKNAVNLGTFGNAVDEDGRLVVKNNVKGSFANGDLPKAVGHSDLLRRYQSVDEAQQASLRNLATIIQQEGFNQRHQPINQAYPKAKESSGGGK